MRGYSKSSIIGIIILAIVLGMVYLSKYLVKEKLEVEKKEAVPLEVAPVKMFVENCLGKTLKEAILTVGKQGGYSALPKLSTQEAYVNTAYYLYLEDLYVPSLEKIKEELEAFIDKEFLSCANLSIFKEFNITSRKPKSNISLTNTSVAVFLDFPLTIGLT